MSNPCEWEVTCTYNCDENSKDCPYVLSYTSEGDWSFPVKTEVSVDLWGHLVFIYKTDRLLSYDYRVAITNPIGCTEPARTGTGKISEDCEYTETELYYVNQEDKIALYKEVKHTISFSGVSEGFVALAVGSFPMEFIKVAVRSETYSRNSEIILLHGDTKIIVDSYSTETTADPHRFFLFPTPDPSAAGGKPMNDFELIQYGFYNSYGNCYEEATPDSLVVLDGGRVPFLPQWLRNFIKDPYYKQSRDMRFRMCQSGEAGYGTYESKLDTSSILPEYSMGNYAKHPVAGELYNFLVKAVSHNGVLNIKSKNIDDAIIAEVQSLGIDDSLREETVYFPISLI